ncbi:MAG: hypothetical protein KAR42_03940 [candidate division Zixibacteria bacterium]|nr:hypothetical protein [candidate division Zixibacteria bacterium]
MKKLLIIIGLLTLIAGLTGDLLAQGGGGNGGTGDGGDRLLAAMNRTDEVIAQAKVVVLESGSKRAEQVLKTAISFQMVSRKMSVVAISNMDVAMGLRAGQKTLDARARAKRAIAITRQAGENQDYVRQRLEKTQGLINRIENRSGEETPGNISQLFDTAKDKQKRAVEFFRSGKLKASLQMTMQAQKSLEKISQRLSGVNQYTKKYQNTLERYFQLEERIREASLSENKEVKKKLQAANIKMQEANELYDNGRYQKADKAMQRAVETLYRLAEKMRDPARIQSELTKLKRVAEKLKEGVTVSHQHQLEEMYRSAIEHLNKAELLSQRGEFNTAAAQLQAARQILNRISNRLER